MATIAQMAAAMRHRRAQLAHLGGVDASVHLAAAEVARNHGHTQSAKDEEFERQWLAEAEREVAALVRNEKAKRKAERKPRPKKQRKAEPSPKRKRTRLASVAKPKKKIAKKEKKAAPRKKATKAKKAAPMKQKKKGGGGKKKGTTRIISITSLRRSGGKK